MYYVLLVIALTCQYSGFIINKTLLHTQLSNGKTKSTTLYEPMKIAGKIKYTWVDNLPPGVHQVGTTAQLDGWGLLKHSKASATPRGCMLNTVEILSTKGISRTVQLVMTCLLKPKKLVCNRKVMMADGDFTSSTFINGQNLEPASS